MYTIKAETKLALYVTRTFSVGSTITWKGFWNGMEYMFSMASELNAQHFALYLSRAMVAIMYVATAVSKVLATANKNRSQITCYIANGDLLFITYYVLKSIDCVISVHHLVLQEIL